MAISLRVLAILLGALFTANLGIAEVEIKGRHANNDIETELAKLDGNTHETNLNKIGENGRLPLEMVLPRMDKETVLQRVEREENDKKKKQTEKKKKKSPKQTNPQDKGEGARAKKKRVNTIRKNKTRQRKAKGKQAKEEKPRQENKTQQRKAKGKQAKEKPRQENKTRQRKAKGKQAKEEKPREEKRKNKKLGKKSPKTKKQNSEKKKTKKVGKQKAKKVKTNSRTESDKNKQKKKKKKSQEKGKKAGQGRGSSKGTRKGKGRPPIRPKQEKRKLRKPKNKPKQTTTDNGPKKVLKAQSKAQGSNQNGRKVSGGKKKKKGNQTKPDEDASMRQAAGFDKLVSSADCGQTTVLDYGASVLLYSLNDGSNARCNQEFQSPDGTTITIDCFQFNFNSNGCKREKLIVFPGIGGQRKSKFCNSIGPSMTTTSNTLELRYRRRRVRAFECSGGYTCTATVNGDRPTTTEATTTTAKPTTTTQKPTTTTTKTTTTPSPTTTTTKPTTTTNPPTTTTTNPPTTTTTNPPTTTTNPPTTTTTTNPPTTTTTNPPTTTTTNPPTTTTTNPPTTTTTNPPTTTTTNPPTTTTTNPPTTTTTNPPTTTTTNPPTTTTTNPPTTTTTNPPTTTTTNPPTSTTGTPTRRLFCDEDCGRSTITVPRIVGGEEATISEYPWQILITISSSRFTRPATCGGSIIKRAWILSAAHCFIDPDTNDLYAGLALTVTVAEHDTSSASEIDSIDIPVPENFVFIHPSYKDQDLFSEDGDIALIFLGGLITFDSGILPICMPVASDYEAEQEVIVTGWGVTSYQGEQPDTLQEVTLTLKSQAECNTLNNNAPETYVVTDNMVCALGPSKDACQGDSGGPLVVQTSDGRWVQLGIVSFGYRCAEENVPGFYTKLSNYIDWITTTTTTDQC